jgi:hypothetical protein
MEGEASASEDEDDLQGASSSSSSSDDDEEHSKRVKGKALRPFLRLSKAQVRGKYLGICG